MRLIPSSIICILLVIANPLKKRDDYPEMPQQSHLDAETRLAAARFMLSVETDLHRHDKTPEY